MKIFAVTNQKGGVGKTTTCVNLAAGLAQLGKKVLLVDLDPQGNATTGCGLDKNQLQHTIYHVLIGQSPVQQAIHATQSKGFSIIPANRNLAGAEVELVNEIGREAKLKTALSELAQDYDYILMDCPPALNLLTVNALTAAQAVIIPMQCEYYALEGLSDLVNTIKKVRQHLNANLEIEGLLRTMFDNRNMLAQQVSAQLMQHFGDKVYQTVIPRNVRLAEAPSHGMPATVYDKSSKGAQAYLSLCKEVIKRSNLNWME